MTAGEKVLALLIGIVLGALLYCVFLVMTDPVSAAECKTVDQLKTKVLPQIEKQLGHAALGKASPKQIPNIMKLYNAMPPESNFTADEVWIITTGDQDANFVFLFNHGCFVNGAKMNAANLEKMMGINS